MILFFGPAGAGKSVQGQLLAKKHGWSWVSTGQLLRASHDPEILQTINAGHLVSDEQIIAMVRQALIDNQDKEQVILDGLPRRLDQAKWLLETKNEHSHTVDVAVVVDVPHAELLKRMQGRGRDDDTPELMEKRLAIYHQEIDPILAYLAEQGIPVVHIEGVGAVEQVSGRINNKVQAILKSS